MIQEIHTIDKVSSKLCQWYMLFWGRGPDIKVGIKVICFMGKCSNIAGCRLFYVTMTPKIYFPNEKCIFITTDW